MRLGRADDAARDWERLLPLSEESRRGYVYRRRAEALVLTGDYRAALAAITAATPKPSDAHDLPARHGVLDLLNRVLHLANHWPSPPPVPQAERQRHVTAALGLLRHAIEAGHFQDPNMVQHLKQRQDLADLRAHHEFPELLKLAEATVKP